jgi:hypothetical protein
MNTEIERPDITTFKEALQEAFNKLKASVDPEMFEALMDDCDGCGVDVNTSTGEIRSVSSPVTYVLDDALGTYRKESLGSQLEAIGIHFSAPIQEGGEGDGAPTLNVYQIDGLTKEPLFFGATGIYSSWDSSEEDEAIRVIRNTEKIVAVKETFVQWQIAGATDVEGKPFKHTKIYEPQYSQE